MACGHTHPRIVRIGDLLIVNPGSVGLPAYDDNHPYPHVIENGSPDARHAIIECISRQWLVELIAVPCDFAGMVALARLDDRPGWAAALGTRFVLRRGQVSASHYLLTQIFHFHNM